MMYVSPPPGWHHGPMDRAHLQIEQKTCPGACARARRQLRSLRAVKAEREKRNVGRWAPPLEAGGQRKRGRLGAAASSMASGRHGSGAYHRRNSSCKARRASIPPLPSAPPARPAAPSVPPAAPSAPSVPEGRSRRRTSSGERTRGGCGLAGATTGHGTWAKRTLGLGLGSGFSLEFGVE